ncbi:hypothetical protein QCA50_018070 [Cerrena zonata]|uniref:Uncharacterized protein n=1 Tax=Cerrena zonata TaxID=2478898 RepID=A0AAW0FBX6_9APHY
MPIFILDWNRRCNVTVDIEWIFCAYRRRSEPTVLTENVTNADGTFESLPREVNPEYYPLTLESSQTMLRDLQYTHCEGHVKTSLPWELEMHRRESKEREEDQEERERETKADDV